MMCYIWRKLHAIGEYYFYFLKMTLRDSWMALLVRARALNHRDTGWIPIWASELRLPQLDWTQ